MIQEWVYAGATAKKRRNRGIVVYVGFTLALPLGYLILRAIVR
jgi:hypothetical protein